MTTRFQAEESAAVRVFIRATGHPAIRARPPLYPLISRLASRSCLSSLVSRPLPFAPLAPVGASAPTDLNEMGIQMKSIQKGGRGAEGLRAGLHAACRGRSPRLPRSPRPPRAVLWCRADREARGGGRAGRPLPAAVTLWGRAPRSPRPSRHPRPQTSSLVVSGESSSSSGSTLVKWAFKWGPLKKEVSRCGSTATPPRRRTVMLREYHSRSILCFRYTESTVISAGVTPGMRDA